MYSGREIVKQKKKKNVKRNKDSINVTVKVISFVYLFSLLNL